MHQEIIFFSNSSDTQHKGIIINLLQAISLVDKIKTVWPDVGYCTSNTEDNFDCQPFGFGRYMTYIMLYSSQVHVDSYLC